MLRPSVKHSNERCLVVLLGPTGVGKTALSLHLARALSASIVSADSRQVFREIPIGTAAPSQEERDAVPHYLVGHRSIHEHYSAAEYESEAIETIARLHLSDQHVLLSGGSMMYIDALCRGIDMIPDVDPEVRAAVWTRYEQEGLEGILGELRLLDPTYYERVDRKNYKRVLHGYEVCLSSGRPFSSFHTGQSKPRPWRTVRVGLLRDREELYRRIDARVLQMMAEGLEAEARAVYPYRALNALRTVGYRELFDYFDGHIPIEEAIRQIQRNSRHYARKQMTWWQRDDSIRWFHPDDHDSILNYIRTVP